LKRRNFRYNLINQHRPLEQDGALFRFWREHVIYDNGPFNAQQLGYLDEASKKKQDAQRLRAHGPAGFRVVLPFLLRGAHDAACAVIMVTIEGVQAVVTVEAAVDGNIGKI
jgi:hypothetical protein